MRGCFGFVGRRDAMPCVSHRWREALARAFIMGYECDTHTSEGRFFDFVALRSE
jgi:hypothetical protein